VVVFTNGGNYTLFMANVKWKYGCVCVWLCELNTLRRETKHKFLTDQRKFVERWNISNKYHMSFNTATIMAIQCTVPYFVRKHCGQFPGTTSH